MFAVDKVAPATPFRSLFMSKRPTVAQRTFQEIKETLEAKISAEYLLITLSQAKIKTLQDMLEEINAQLPH